MSHERTKKALNLAATWPFRLTPHRIRRFSGFGAEEDEDGEIEPGRLNLEGLFDSLAEDLPEDYNDRLRDLESSLMFNALGTYVTLDLLFNGGEMTENVIYGGSWMAEGTDPLGNPYDLAGEIGERVTDTFGFFTAGRSAEGIDTPFEIYSQFGEFLSDYWNEVERIAGGARDKEFYDHFLNAYDESLWGEGHAGAAAAVAGAVSERYGGETPEDLELDLEYSDGVYELTAQPGGETISLTEENGFTGEEVGRLAQMKKDGEL